MFDRDSVLPEIKATKREGHSGCYEIAPLDRGFSRSFANGLRRTLLSSLSGAAITSIQIEGVQHEFQDIPEVREDVTDIVQNLKQVRLRSYFDRTVCISLDVHGERLVTAGDMKIPSSIEIVNPKARIATLDNEKAHLCMEMTVDVGRGFVPADALKEGQPIGVIAIDAIYSPVRHVHFTIEPVRVGALLGLDKIILEVTTDGTISPDEALRQAADILRKQFAVFARDHYESDASEKPPRASALPIPRRIYTLPVEELALSTRTSNVLRRHNITIVGQLLEMGEAILSLRNMGERTMQEIYECMKIHYLLPEVTERRRT